MHPSLPAFALGGAAPSSRPQPICGLSSVPARGMLPFSSATSPSPPPSPPPPYIFGTALWNHLVAICVMNRHRLEQPHNRGPCAARVCVRGFSLTGVPGFVCVARVIKNKAYA